MADLLIDIDDITLEGIQIRARSLNMGAEAFLRHAIHELARPTRAEFWVAAERWRSHIDTVSSDSVAVKREDRDSRQSGS